ncbi:protease modulator HflC [Photobacterium aphoticum]|uniref:Protein HflC n=1 Tax=Photobacterium aphoticum TaxID=754436 RepID=A0A0J1GJ47_9GAMM|nr:protease modulator HflC [Photobacterium aphoticum]KLU99722.1 protein HflC [Photobacterium aphoticum]PSU55740.1 protease modulator HflC [Photobacterium aphoticum]GHA66479.1 protein HflC [Photobacterium aphoticum]
MRKLMVPVIVVFIAALLMSMFVVKEGERAIVFRFSSALKDANSDVVKVYEPGLHFKLPLFDTARLFEARIQTMDDQADRFVTSEKKDVIIDTYVKWRIKDFDKYYKSTSNDVSTAEGLMKRKVVDSLRAEIGLREIKQIVSGPERKKKEGEATDTAVTDTAAVTDTTTDAATTLPAETVEMLAEAEKPLNAVVEGQRDQIMANVLADIKVGSMEDLGVEIVDFRIKKINLPDEISESIYQRMRAERESVARKHRSQGREQAEVLRAKADLAVTQILSNANRDALVVRGEADAEAAEIYSAAFGKNPEFYNFLRSLKAYENSFKSKNDILVIDPNTEFFKYMKDAQGTAN